MKHPLFLPNAFFVVFVPAIFFLSCEGDDELNVVKEYRFNKTITMDGSERTYSVNLPPDYYETSSAFPLVIAMHGGGGSADQFESTSGLTEKANDAGFIVVYPEGLQGSGLLKVRTWNAGICCGGASSKQVDDVKFIGVLIDQVINTYNVDPKKVYATGHSNGGMMSYRLACEMSDRIAAIAVSGCSMVTTACNPSRPVPILHMHSALDEMIPYQGGIGTGLTGVYFPPVDSVLTVWSQNNSCDVTSQVLQDDSDYKLTQWSSCDDNVMIKYYLTQDGGHGWPGGLPGGVFADIPSKVINANDLLWEFFVQYQLPN